MEKIVLVFIAFLLVLACMGYHFAQKDNIKNTQNLTNIDNTYQGGGGEFRKGGAGGSW